MAKINDFIAAYEAFAEGRPVNFSFEKIKTGIPRWRMHIFERGTAPTGGDRELLCVEEPTKEGCLKKSIERLQNMMREEVQPWWKCS